MPYGGTTLEGRSPVELVLDDDEDTTNALSLLAMGSSPMGVGVDGAYSWLACSKLGCEMHNLGEAQREREISATAHKHGHVEQLELACILVVRRARTTCKVRATYPPPKFQARLSCKQQIEFVLFGQVLTDQIGL